MKHHSTSRNLILALMVAATMMITAVNAQTGSTGNPCRDKYCARCDSAGGCLKCIGRIRNHTSSGFCDSQISQGDCASWSYHPHNYCETCKPGYLINENNLCSKSTISCCKQGSVVAGQEICTACENTMPNYHRTKCNEKLEIPNCRWGMRQGQLEACAYCKEGYSVYGYGCVPNCVHGCSHCSKAYNGTQFIRRCIECDWNRGFYMTSQNVCTYSKFLSIGLVSLLAIIGLIW